MKFIDLKQDGKSPYDSIITNSCGPNYVLNRLDLFESMIKEQGIIFWFRFWLMFSSTPCCSDLEMIQKQWPYERTTANIQIHKEFLKGSVEDMISYCLNEAINQLKFARILPHTSKRKTSYQMLNNLVQECSDTAFGASLCEVFYKWLKAKDLTGKCQNYWQIPNEYLDPAFEPGILEKFLVERWDNNLVVLLGVNLRDIPWLLKILYSSKLTTELMYHITDKDPMLSAIVEFLRKYRHRTRVHIRNADEHLEIRQTNPDAGKINRKSRSSKKNGICCNNVNSGFPNDASLQHEDFSICCYCSGTGSNLSNLIKCKRCISENWEKPRCYCTFICQMEHWFLNHNNEHNVMEMHETNNSSGPLETMPKPLTRGIKHVKNTPTMSTKSCMESRGSKVGIKKISKIVKV